MPFTKPIRWLLVNLVSCYSFPDLWPTAGAVTLNFHPWGSPTGEVGVETGLEEGGALEGGGRGGGRRRQECPVQSRLSLIPQEELQMGAGG